MFLKNKRWLMLLLFLITAMNSLGYAQNQTMPYTQNPMDSDSNAIGITDRVPYFQVNQFTGKVNASLDGIGPGAIGVKPFHKSNNRTKLFQTSADNFLDTGNLGFGWHLHHGLLIVTPYKPLSEGGQWETVQLVSPSGDISSFTRDLTFTHIPDGLDLNEWGPDEDDTTSGRWFATRADTHFIDQGLRRITREIQGHSLLHYYLMDRDGSLTKFAPTPYTTEPNNQGDRVWVPVEKVFPNQRKITITYASVSGVSPIGDLAVAEVPSFFIDKVYDHAQERWLTFHYGSNGSTSFNQSGDRRYVTKVTLHDGQNEQTLCEFDYEYRQVNASRSDWVLKETKRPINNANEVTSFSYGSYTLSGQFGLLIEKITNPQGATVQVQYEEVNLGVAFRLPVTCQITTDQNCVEPPRVRPVQMRISDIFYDQAHFHYDYHFFDFGDSSNPFSELLAFQGGSEPITPDSCGPATQGRFMIVDVQELNSQLPSQTLRYRSTTSYQMENTQASYIPRNVGMPLIQKTVFRSKSLKNPSQILESSQRKEWVYQSLFSECIDGRLGGTKKQGWFYLPMAVKYSRDFDSTTGNWTIEKRVYNFDTAFDLPIEIQTYRPGFDKQTRHFSYEHRWGHGGDEILLGCTECTPLDACGQTDCPSSGICCSASGLLVSAINSANNTRDDYVLGLKTSDWLINEKNGVRETKSRVTYKYQDPYNRPLVTRVRNWINATESLDKRYVFYGPTAALNDKGLLEKSYGSTTENTRIFYDYRFGIHTRMTYPENLLPDLNQSVDMHGNITSKTDQGVTKTYQYDAFNRMRQESDGVNRDTFFNYSDPGQPVETIEYVGDNRFKTVIYSDDWYRPVQSDIEVDNRTGLQTVGQRFTHYDALGFVNQVESALGSLSRVTYDVLGQPLESETADTSGTPIATSTIVRSSNLFGGVTAAQFSGTDWSGIGVERVAKTDHFGRLVWMGTNPPAVYSNLESSNYTGGGHTEFEYSFEASSGLWKTIMKPYGTTNTSEWRVFWEDWLGRKVKEKHPEHRSKSNQSGSGNQNYYYYDYDGLGRLVRQTLAEDSRLNPSEVYRFTYDALDRVTARKRVNANGSEDLLTSYHYHPTSGQLLRSEQYLQGNEPVVTEFSNFDSLHRPQSVSTSVPAVKPPNEAVMWVGSGINNQLIAYWAVDRGLGNAATNVYNLRIRPKQFANSKEYDLVFANIAGPGNPAISWVEKAFSVSDFQQKLQQLSPAAAQVWQNLIEPGSPYVLDPEHEFQWQIQTWDPINFESSPATSWQRFNPLPDLMVSHLEVEPPVATGPYNLEIRILNQGNLQAPTSGFEVILAEAADGTGNPLTVATQTTSSLGPGMDETFSLNLELDRLVDPATGLPTRNFLIVEVDPNDQIKEGGGSFEENNQKAFYLGTGGNPNPNLPDLMPRNLDHLFVYLGGGVWDAIGLWNIVNSSDTQTGASSGESETDIYLSDVNFLGDQSQVKLASVLTPPLAPTENITQFHKLYDTTSIYQIPQQFMVVNADSRNEVTPEGNEANNAAGYSLEGNRGTGPDVRIHQVHHDGYNGSSGVITGVQFSVKNIGVWPSGVHRSAIYLSDNELLDDDDFLVTDNVFTPNIQPEAASQLLPDAPMSIAIPSHYQSGNNWLIFVADVDDDVAEGSSSQLAGENNNQRFVSFSGFPEFSIQDLSFNDSNGIDLVVINEGNIASEATTVEVFIERGQATTVTAGSESLFSLPVSAMQPGQSLTISTPASWTIPLATDDQTLLFMVDPSDNQSEVNEDNNTAYILVPGVPAETATTPDIAAFVWRIPDGMGMVDIHYFNRSETVFYDPWTIELRVSTDDRLSADDQPIHGFSNLIGGITSPDPVFWKSFDASGWYQNWLLPTLSSGNCPNTCDGCPPSCSEWRSYEDASTLYFFVTVDVHNTIFEGTDGGENNNQIMFSWSRPTGQTGGGASKTGGSLQSGSSAELPDFQMLRFEAIDQGSNLRPTEGLWELQFRLTNPHSMPVEVKNLSYFLQTSGTANLNRDAKLLFTDAVKWNEDVGIGSNKGADHSDQVAVLQPGESLEVVQMLCLPTNVNIYQSQISLYSGAKWVHNVIGRIDNNARVKHYLNFTTANLVGSVAAQASKQKGESP